MAVSNKPQFEPRRILLLQPSAVGEVVLTSPLIKAIKQRYPGARISLMVGTGSKEIAHFIPGVDEVISFERRRNERGLPGLLQTAARIRRGGYDLLLSPHCATSTSLLAFLSGVPLRVGYNSGLGRLVYNLKANRMKNEPCSLVQHTRLLQLLNIKLDDTRPSLHQPRDMEEYLDSFYRANGLDKTERLAALCPGAKTESERWPAVYFSSLADMLRARGLRPVLFGSPSEIRLASDIANACREKIPRCMSNNNQEAAALLARCVVCVGGNSDLTHMARALGLPTVIILGPTDPRAYRFEDSTWVLTAPLACRPCGTRKVPKRCPHGHHDCMRLISPEQVLQTVRQLINLKTPPPEPFGQAKNR